METDSNKTKQDSQITSEKLFDRLNKVITSWFTWMKTTVWVLTIFLGIFALIGIVFFGYNMWEIQKEIKLRVKEFEKASKELHVKAAEIDSLRLEIEKQLERIVAHYGKNFEILQKDLEKKVNIKLSKEFKPRYTPGPKSK